MDQIEAVSGTRLHQRGEAVTNEVVGLVADVEVDAVGSAPLDLGVDGPGHDVPGSQLGHFVDVSHEATSVVSQQDTALAANGLGDEEVLRLRMV